MARALCQNPDLVVRPVDNDLFLINEEYGQIHHLNQTAAGVWRFLEAPAAVNDIVDVFSTLFPDTSKTDMKAAIRSLVKDLIEKEILIKTDRR